VFEARIGTKTCFESSKSNSPDKMLNRREDLKKIGFAFLCKTECSVVSLGVPLTTTPWLIWWIASCCYRLAGSLNLGGIISAMPTPIS